MLWGTHDEVTTALKAVGGREAVSGKLLPDDTEHATTSRALWLVPDPQTNTGIAFSWLDMTGDLSANLHLKQHPAQDDSVLAMTAEFNPRGPENPMGGHQRGEWVTCEVKSLDNGSERQTQLEKLTKAVLDRGNLLLSDAQRQHLNEYDGFFGGFKLSSLARDVDGRLLPDDNSMPNDLYHQLYGKHKRNAGTTAE